MPTDQMKPESTKYPGVRRHGDVLYYRVVQADGKRVEIRYGEGRPVDAYRARMERQELEHKIKAGLVDRRQHEIEQHALRPALEVLPEFIEHMKGKGDSAGHIKNVEKAIKECLQVCGAQRLLELDPVRVNRWLSDLALSARSKNYRRTSILAFCKWACDYGRVPRNPVPSALIPRFDEEADRRRLSRAMTADEFGRLLDSLRHPGKHMRKRGMLERRAFYLVAGNTGLRWVEISRLRWCDFDLDEGVVIVPAGQTKNGRSAELPLAPQVVEALRGIRPLHCEARAQVFQSQPQLRTWQCDLERAGIIGKSLEGYRDRRGRQLDRKCLRMSFCTWLKEAGVDLRDAQALMRHSDPKLTSNVYTDIRMDDLRRAVNKIESHPTEDASRTDDQGEPAG